MGGGFAGLIGSQASEISLLLHCLPNSGQRDGRGGLTYLCLVFALETRRPEASGLSYWAEERSDVRLRRLREKSPRLRSKAGMGPSTAACGRLRRNESWKASQIGVRRPAACLWQV